jgi:tetratricopeptide (TPR) repeat protein
MRGWAFATSLLALLVLAAPVRAQPAAAEDDSAALVAIGRRAIARGELRDAARALDQAIALNPRRIDAYVLRAAVHMSRRELDAGIALLGRARDLAPDNPDVLTLLGSMLVLAGRGDQGAPILEDVARRHPDRYQAHAALGRHHARHHRWRDAAASLERYLATRPERLAASDPTFRTELADAYLRARQPGRARDLFAALVADAPGDLRARLGLAWATAAIDCRRARPLLAALEPSAAEYPEIWLVAGRCALASGDAATAAALARRASARAGARRRLAANAGVLVGDAAAARGDLRAAAAALRRARAADPTLRAIAPRLSAVLRRSGDLDGARAELDAAGEPDPARDPAWWRELGEVLLAAGRGDEAARRLTPVARALPGDAALRAVLGEALLATGDGAGAIAWLGEAEALRSTPRTRAALARALARVAAERIAARDLAAAEAGLARADALLTTDAPLPLIATIARNLGVVRLGRGRAATAIAPLDRAVRAAPDAITWMLLARARAGAGQAAAARTAYATAASMARGRAAVEVAIDAAAFELAAGRAEIAAAALDRVASQATGAMAARHRAALTAARHAAGLRALRAGDVALAVRWLDAAMRSLDDARGAAGRAVACDLAVATAAAGDRTEALRRLRALGAAPCPFPAPADTVAAPILTALVDGLRPDRAAAALDRLASLQAAATGTAAPLWRAAVRAVALRAADDAYRAGRLAVARRFVLRARGAASDDEVTYDVAVLDLAEGRLDAAVATLERLAPRVPEALVHLGIARDRRGDATGALDAWRRARKAGVRFAPLAEWIAAKERLWEP